MAIRLALFVVAVMVGVGAAARQTGAPSESAGALDVSTYPGMCVEATEMRLWEVQTSSTGVTGRTGREPIKSVDCRWTVAGLTAGTYQVTVGLNTFDWVISGPGRLTVRVSGIQPGLPTRVRVDSRRASDTVDIAPGAEPVLTKEGLDLGEYDVSATQGTFVSTIERVRLDGSHSAIAVDLKLIENRSQLILSGPDGNPPRNTRVQPVTPAHLHDRAETIEPTAPGVYPLHGLRPGMYLLIRADDVVAACHTVPLNSTVYATLETGRRVEIQLPRDLTPAVVRELAALSDVPGSDCPVPLGVLAPTVKDSVVAGQPPTFEFAHFPSISRLGLLRFGLPPRQILVPDRGEVVVE